MVARPAIEDEPDLAALGLVDEKEPDPALGPESDAEKLDTQKLLDESHKDSTVTTEHRVKVWRNQRPTVGDGFAIGLRPKHSLMVTLEKRKRIRRHMFDQVWSGLQTLGQRDPGQTTGREIVGGRGAIVATATFEKPMKSGL